MSCPDDSPKEATLARGSSGLPRARRKLPTLRDIKARFLAGQALETEDLLSLAATPAGVRLANELVTHGLRLSVDQLLLMGDPKDEITGGSLASHVVTVVHRGKHYAYSTEDLLRLGNPADHHGWTPAHNQAHTPDAFSVEDLLRLGDPKNGLGNSVSSLLVEQGRRFSAAELVQLKNPADKEGKTLAHHMIQTFNRVPEPEYISGCNVLLSI